MKRILATLLFALALAAHARAAGHELAPRPVLPTNQSFSDLEVAAAGDRFLTVWNANGAIYGVLSNTIGQRVSPAAFLIAEMKVHLSPALAVVGTGDSFAVFWNDASDALTPREVHMTDVALDGRILGTRTLALPSAEGIRAAWDGQRFLVAIHRGNQYVSRSVAALVARDGTVLREDLTLERTAVPVHVAVMDNGFLVFSDGRDLIANFIFNDGSTKQLIAGDPGANLVSAPIGIGRLLVAYRLDDGRLRTMLWRDGAKRSEHTLDTGRDATPAGILPGISHLLVYGQEQVYTVSLNDEGVPISEPARIQRVLSDARSAVAGDVMLISHLSHGSIASLMLPMQSTDILSMHPAVQSHVLMGAGGGSMIAVWNESTDSTGGSRILAAKIGRDFDSGDVREIARGSLVTQTLAWNGTEYLAAYEDQSGRAYVVRIGYDGTRIGEPHLLAEPGVPIHAAVAWAGDRWAVAWVAADASPRISYQTISYGGVPSSVQELDVTDNLPFDVALAFDGSRVHLGWIETPYVIEPPPFGYAVNVTRLRRNGRVVDAAPLAIPSTAPRGIALAASGDRIVVLVDDKDRTASHVIDARTRLLVSTRTLYDGIARDSDVTWTGYEFVAAIHHRENNRTLLEIQPLGSNGTSTAAPRVIETLGRTDLRVSIASSPSYDAVAGLQESAAAFGKRAVIYAEREMFR